MMLEARIAGLFVYPVKSCRGIFREAVALEQRGLAHDRRWLIVRPDGRFMTQREIPALTSIVPEITRTHLVLHFGGRSVAIDLEQPGRPMEVSVWKDRFPALTQPEAVDLALTEHLGRPARLVRFDPDVVRPCNPEVSPPGAHAAFSDEFPLLLTNVASLARLNDGLLEAGAATVPMDRFRPNIVVEGLPAWAEDHHPHVRLDAMELRLVSPCERCIVTTTDQQTGVRHGSEPIRTLRKLHADPAGKPLFGWNAAPLYTGLAAPVLRIGMPVRFLPGRET